MNNNKQTYLKISETGCYKFIQFCLYSNLFFSQRYLIIASEMVA